MEKRLSNPTNILAGAIAIYEDVWSDYKKTIEDAEQVASDSLSNIVFVPAQTSADLKDGDTNKQSIRTNYCLDLIPASKLNNIIKNISDEYTELMMECLNGYIKIFDIHEPIINSEDYGLLKYSGGEYYSAHYDGSTANGRCVSAILYLNDDYEGGEIEFVNFGIKIKPKAGMFMLFPSNYAYRHAAHPVTSGTKYAIVTWLHDR